MNDDQICRTCTHWQGRQEDESGGCFLTYKHYGSSATESGLEIATGGVTGYTDVLNKVPDTILETPATFGCNRHEEGTNVHEGVMLSKVVSDEELAEVAPARVLEYVQALRESNEDRRGLIIDGGVFLYNLKQALEGDIPREDLLKWVDDRLGWLNEDGKMQ